MRNINFGFIIRHAILLCLFAALPATAVLGATYSIEISMLDESGTAISGVTFMVNGKVAAASVNGAKNYVVQGLAAGTHFINPQKAGWTFLMQQQSLALPTNGETYSPNGKLSYTGRGIGSIQGQVYRQLADGTRQGIRNFSVTRSGSSTPVTTDLDGNYIFSDLPPGTYTIKAALSGFTVSPASMTVNAAVKAGDANNDSLVDRSDAQPIVSQLLGKGPAPGNPDANSDGKVNVADVVRINNTILTETTTDFAVTGSYRISGSVKTSSGAAIANALVTCTGSDGTGGSDVPHVTTRTDASGNYTINHLGPGVYTVIPISGGKVLAPATASVSLPTSGITGSPDGTATFTATANNDSSALMPLAYYFSKDSDGTVVRSGGIVMLLFEPNGIVDLYVSVVDDGIAYQGTYVYNSGKLTLKFTDPDLTRNATFTFDPTKSSLTIPFKIFSEGSGSSSWTRQAPPLIGRLSAIFKAASLSWPASYYDEAIARVIAYAQANTELGGPSVSSAPRVTAATPPPKITVIRPMTNGVKIKFDSGPELKLILFGWSNADGLPLTSSPLANDPRLNLDTVPAEHFDAPVRRALLITPFFSNHNLAWYDANFLQRRADDYTRQRYFHYSMEKDDNVVGMSDQLKKKRYEPIRLQDNQVTLPKLIDELNQSPGFIYFSTHGGSDGTLATGIYLGDTMLDTLDDARRVMTQVVNQLSTNTLYREIINYKADPSGNLTTLCIVTIPRSLGGAGSPSGLSYFIGIAPNFWEALRVKGHANFNNSLVYISACATDQTADLRNAIRSRAYFGYNINIPSEFAGAVFQYFCKHLSRRTHTPEEAYYNIIRVAGTRLKIYLEDDLLQDTIPRVEATRPEDSAGIPQNHLVQVKDVFRGYGSSFSTRELPLPYRGNGWLKLGRKDFDAGVVWWHLFSARWGGDAQDSRDAIMNICWKQYWSRGNTGKLASPGCQNMTSGRVPWPAELSYMAYLLTGAPYQFASPRLVPRWTLNDKP